MRYKISLCSLIYVYKLYHSVLFHKTKNHKNLRTNFKICNPSRLEFSNKSPLEDKEKAETPKKKLKNLDQAVHAKSTDVPRGCLDVQEDQSREKLQRNDEDLQLQIDNVKPHTMIKSFFPWKSKPKITFIVMI